jgi:hypothetical protein
MLSSLYTEPFSSRRDLEIACRYNAVTTVISPTGVRVELHRVIDSKGHIFNPRDLLAKAELFPINGVSYCILPAPTLFVYICYHHSRHKWARLHWVADLDAVQRHASFNQQAVETFASDLGLLTTVRASLDLHQVCSSSNPYAIELKTPAHRSMQDACLQSIACQEYISAAHGPRADAFDNWCILFRYLAIVSLCPTYADYKTMPLPKAWHGIYYLTRPLRMGWQVFSQTLGRKVRAILLN